jgi:adenylate cyclase
MQVNRKHDWRPLLLSLVIGAVVFAAVWVTHAAGLLQFVELKTYDRLLRAQSREQGPSPIVVIGVTEQDIAELESYPLTDEEMAAALTTILEASPRVIGLDIFRDKKVEPGHDELIEILKNHEKIIIPVLIHSVEALRVGAPEAIVGDLDRPYRFDRIGFVDVVEDRDEIMRRALVMKTPDDEAKDPYASLAFWLAAWYLAEDGIEPLNDEHDPDLLHFGKLLFRSFASTDGLYVGADDGGSILRLDYAKTRPFTFHTYGELRAGKVDPQSMHDKIVLLGVTSSSVKDNFRTPLHETIYGVEWHALITDQLIRAAKYGEVAVGYWSDRVEAAWTLMWSLLATLAAFRLRSLVRFVAVMIGGLLVLGVTVYLLFGAGWWVPGVAPGLCWLISGAVVTSYGSARERHDRRILTQLFGQQVSSQVVQVLWNKRDELLGEGRLRGQKGFATVMFTDLIGYTERCEDAAPTEVISWLNEYMDEMTTLVVEHGGMVKEFIGDSVMGVFGPPLERTEPAEFARDANNAVRCALAMRSRLAQISKTDSALAGLGMRVGIHSGPVVEGSIGSRMRLQYVVLGDTVNIASRLESFDKTVMDDDIAASRCRILISGVTRDLLTDQCNTRPVESALLKGKSTRIDIFGVVD